MDDERQGEPVIIVASPSRPWNIIDDGDEEAIQQKHHSRHHGIAPALYYPLGAPPAAFGVANRQKPPWEDDGRSPEAPLRKRERPTSASTPLKHSTGSDRQLSNEGEREAALTPVDHHGAGEDSKGVERPGDSRFQSLDLYTSSAPTFSSSSSSSRRPTPESSSGSGALTDGYERREKNHRRKPDPDQESAPPRPPNAFILYRSAHSASASSALPPSMGPATSSRKWRGNTAVDVDDQHGAGTNHSSATPTQQQSLSKSIAERWNSEPQAVKDFWYTEAQKKKKLHELMYPGYKFQPRSSEKVRQEREARATKRNEDASKSETKTRGRSSSRASATSGKSSGKKPYADESSVRQRGRARAAAGVDHQQSKSSGNSSVRSSISSSSGSSVLPAATPSTTSSKSATPSSPVVVHGDVFSEDATPAKAASSGSRLDPSAASSSSFAMPMTSSPVDMFAFESHHKNESQSVDDATPTSNRQSASTEAPLAASTPSFSFPVPPSNGPIRVEVDIERLLRLDSATLCELLGIPASPSPPSGLNTVVSHTYSLSLSLSLPCE